jgi:dTMP kinase
MKNKGKFIVFEGIDGCGKTNQIDLLKKGLKKQGVEAVFTREHTVGWIGRMIDEVVRGERELDPQALQLLFVADRLEHLKRIIKPALQKGKLVVCDRYFWSTVAYGSLVADREWLLEINKVCLLPDLVILIDLSPKVAVKRISKNREELTIFEKEKKLKKVRKTYLWLAKRFADSCVVIDGTPKPKKINREIFTILRDRLIRIC